MLIKKVPEERKDDNRKEMLYGENKDSINDRKEK